MGSAREPIVLSDSDDEGQQKRRAVPHSGYTRQTGNLESHYPRPPEQRQTPPQRSWNRSSFPTLGFSQTPRGVHQPTRPLPPTNSPRTQVPLATQRPPMDYPGSGSIPVPQRRPVLSNEEISLASISRLFGLSLSSAMHKNGNSSARMSNSSFPERASAPVPQPQAQSSSPKEVVSAENNRVPTQPTRPISDLSSKKICQRCVRTNTRCDGLQPCTPCKQTHNKCSYQTKIVRLPVGSSLNSSADNHENPGVFSKPGRVANPNSIRNASGNSAQTHVNDHGIDGHVESHEPQQKLRLSYDMATAELDHDNTSSDESTQNLEIDLSIDAVRKLVDDMVKEQHAWQEKSVQADLRQATYDMKTRRLPDLDLSMPDPFRVAFEKRKAAEAEHTLDAAETNGVGKTSARPQQKKVLLTRAVEKRFKTAGNILPKYKAIGRISSTFLAPNCHTQKYRPYDAEDEIQDPESTEKYLELEQRFNNNYDGLKAQRDCQELIWLWKPWVKHLLASMQIKAEHVIYYFVRDHFEQDRQLKVPWTMESGRAWALEWTKSCTTCELASQEERITSFSRNKFDELDRPDDRSLALAGLVAYAFHQMSRISMWHIVTGGLIQPPQDEWEDDENGSEPCLICFRHHCPSHGNFLEVRDEDQAEDTKAYVNDEEKKQNIRKFMSLPAGDQKDQKEHACGVFCVDSSQSLQQIVGWHPDGTVVGDSRINARTRSSFQENELCSSTCFWDVSRRRNIKISEVKFQPFLSQSHRTLVEKVMRFYHNHLRGPCVISRIVKDVTCEMVFNHMIYCMMQQPHPSLDGDSLSDTNSAQRIQNAAKKKRKPVTIMDVSRSGDLDQRPPFLPCSHEGPCHNDPKCNCYRFKVHCERFCGCDESCRRRFKGCTCVARGNKVCFKDNRCECWKLNRECDPSLCGKCGVYEVLDSYNKYNDEIRKGRCRNNRIQLGLPAPTTKAPSQIQGYGLYSRTAILREEFIGEYTGELISKSEGNRRGAMYHVLGQEYLFTINKAQEIDASNNGNKMRFMNNSQREEHINVEPKMLWCSGVVRVGLFAKRDIEAGEELLYNYNYPESKVQYFWEPGERPANTRAVVPLSHERTARTITAPSAVAAFADAMDNDSRSPSPIVARTRKRKRIVDDSSSELEVPKQTTRVAGTARRVRSENGVSRVPEIEDSEGSDYGIDGRWTEEDEAVEEAGFDDERDSSAGEALKRTKSKSRKHKSSKDRSSKIVVGVSSRRSKKRSRITGTPAARRVYRLKDQMDGGMLTPKQAARAKSLSRSSHTKNRSGNLVVRKRKIGPNDRRFGGRAQQLAWETRRMNEALANSGSKG